MDFPTPRTHFAPHGAHGKLRAGEALLDEKQSALQDSLAGSAPVCPALALFGAEDGCSGPEISEGMEAFFPAGVNRHVVPGAGHFLHLEAADRVARLILDFLED